MSVRLLYFLTFLLSACSILYELILAQSLSATLGSTFLRYNLTIGFYLAALGAGALLCGRWTRGRELERLIDVELALSWVGVLCPFLILLWDSLVFHAAVELGFAFRGLLYQGAIHIFNQALILLVGVLSGFELPLLMRLGSSSSVDRSTQVLAVDYFGTLAGAVAFPLLILPAFGVINAAVTTGLCNALCGLYLVLVLGAGSPPRGRVAGYLAVIALCLALLLNSEAVHGPFIERFYG